MSDLVLAIDAGTTGIKVLLVDSDASVRARSYAEFSQSYPEPGWVEHDPEEIWQTAHNVLAQALEEGGASASQVAGLGITDQRETTVLWERSTGRPVAPAIVWQDRRTAPICERLKTEGLEEEVARRTGLVLDPYFSGTKIMWLLDNVEGLRKRAEAGDIAFGTIDSWLIYKMTGGEVHATEPSNASRTLLYSLEDRTWDEWLLERFEIPRELLPEIKPSAGRFGETTSELFKGGSIAISGVAGDQQAALFGQACFEPGMVKNTYGTGSFVLLNTGDEVQRSTHGILTTAAWDLGDTYSYALEGSIFATGAAIQWLRDGLEIIDDASATGPLAESVPDAGGTYFVPAFVGLGAPHWDPYARGAYIGITRGSTKAHLARAVVESMTYQTRDVLDAMTADSGIAPAELRVDGGASVMDVLCQLQADQLGVVVKRPKNLETTALGSGYLAGLAEGVWSSTADIQSAWRAEVEFEPKASRDEVDTAYEGWKRALERSRGWVEH
ncbi:MAG: glycerol kinase GlpK [Actinomycetota bacterium]|nr:glycerol kinase GlpK [Actinomycetota bacterium]